MTNTPNYLSGKPASGSWAHPPRKTPTPPNRPWLDRNGTRLIVLCTVVMLTLGAASWGAPKLFRAINSYVDVGVE